MLTPNGPPLLPVVLLAIVLVLPVFAVIFVLGDALAGFAYLLLAIVVLFFSLGPRDIGEEVDEYCKALEGEDEEEIRRGVAILGEVIRQRQAVGPDRLGARAVNM